MVTGAGGCVITSQPHTLDCSGFGVDGLACRV